MLRDLRTWPMRSVVHRTVNFRLLALRQEAFIVDEFPIVCHSGLLPENGVATDDTLHWRIESLHRGRDEQWHGGRASLRRAIKPATSV